MLSWAIECNNLDPLEVLRKKNRSNTLEAADLCAVDPLARNSTWIAQIHDDALPASTSLILFR
jgi:hypothetical protein